MPTTLEATQSFEHKLPTDPIPNRDLELFPDILSKAAVLRSVQDEIYKNAVTKGFWENKKERNFGEAIALIHEEVSEALSAQRLGNPPDDKIPTYSGVEAELADVMIRVLDLAAGYDMDVIGAMFEKMAFNKTRPYKHGKKF